MFVYVYMYVYVYDMYIMYTSYFKVSLSLIQLWDLNENICSSTESMFMPESITW